MKLLQKHLLGDDFVGRPDSEIIQEVFAFAPNAGDFIFISSLTEYS